MTTDILLDVNQKDFLYGESYSDKVFYTAEYGMHQLDEEDTTPYLDIIIPSGYSVNPVSDDVYVKVPYIPSTTPLNIRFLRHVKSTYTIIQVDGEDSHQGFIFSYDGQIRNAVGCVLYGLDVDGLLRLRFSNDINETGGFEIYKADQCDFMLGPADRQCAELMMVCGPGKNYRYPISGVGTPKYMGSIIDRTSVAQTILDELGGDSQGVKDVFYESDTEKLRVNTDEYNNTQSIDEVDKSELDMSAFKPEDGQ